MNKDTGRRRRRLRRGVKRLKIIKKTKKEAEKTDIN